jgi:hypothetical protein
MKKNLLFSFLTVVAVTFSIFPSMGQSSGLAFPVITEIMYNPPESGTDSLEFIEIYNSNLTTPLNVSGYYFSSGITYTFPVGSEIPADGFAVVAIDSVAFENVFGISAFQWDGGQGLNNSGESIAIRDASGFLVDTVFYDDNSDWPSSEADQGGASLVLCDPTSDNNDPANWAASTNDIGFNSNGLDTYADPYERFTCTTVGIADDNVITTVVYPNPAKDVFSMQFEPTQEAGTLNIFNNIGQVVYTKTLSVGTTATTIDSRLPSGLYIVSLNVGDKREQHRLIVE